MSAAIRNSAATAAAYEIACQRDDGPAARAAGRVLSPLVPFPAVALLLAALTILLAGVAFGGADISRPAAAAILVCVAALAAASRSSPSRARIRWAEPPLLRAIEFVGLTWIAAMAGASAYPAAFALLAALTFRHYDLVYRMRIRGDAPRAWINTVAGGWDGRLIVAFIMLLAGALPAGYYVAAAVLAVAFVAESAIGWRATPRRSSAADEENEEWD